MPNDLSSGSSGNREDIESRDVPRADRPPAGDGSNATEAANRGTQGDLRLPRTGEIRVLSVRQPYAWAICAGLKRIENRTWQTKYRGTVAIHASTSKAEVNDIRRYAEGPFPPASWFDYGMIVGLAEIVEIQTYGREHEEDPYACGPYCWRLANPRFLRQPIPLKGRLNLFTPSDDVLSQLRSAEAYGLDPMADGTTRNIAVELAGDPEPVAGYESVLENFWYKREHVDQIQEVVRRIRELAPGLALIPEMEEAIAEVTGGGVPETGAPSSRSTARTQTHEIASGNPWESVVVFADDVGSPPAEDAQKLQIKAQLEQGNIREARLACDALLTLRPDDADAWELSGWIRLEEKDFFNALGDALQGLGIAPGNENLELIRQRAIEQL